MPNSKLNTRPLSAEKAATTKTAREELARAFKRSEAWKAELLKRPDMLTLAQFARRVKSRVAVIDGRRAANKLLALDLAPKTGARYPDWQCDLVLDARHRKGYERALQVFAKSGDLAKYRFFITTSPALGGRTPIQALQGDEIDSVVKAAETWINGEQGGG